MILRLLPLLFFPCLLLADNEEREIDRKELSLQFESREEAGMWNLSKLSFPDWLETVSIDGGERLHESETPDFYFAVFRSGDHLVFCVEDRKRSVESSSTGIAAEDGSPIWVKPSKWVSLVHELEFPNGSISFLSRQVAFQIADDYAGPIEVSHSIKSEGKSKKVFEESVVWK